MKKLLRMTFFNAVSLFLLTLAFPGVQVSGGVPVFILGGLLLSFISLFIKPIINIISLPLNLISLGFFSFLTNALILYILTVLIPQITVKDFTYPGFKYGGFIIPEIHFNLVFAYIVTACMLAVLDAFMSWITEK